MVNISSTRPKNLPIPPKLPLPSPGVGDVPLVQLKDGSVRFKGTRVSFDTIIYAFKQGCDPAQINGSYDLISIPDIEKAIEYYQSEREIVDRYLAARKEAAEIWREFNEKLQSSSDWQARVQRLRNERKQPV